MVHSSIYKAKNVYTRLLYSVDLKPSNSVMSSIKYLRCYNRGIPAYFRRYVTKLRFEDYTTYNIKITPKTS